jgi:hypothetical protein
MVAPFDEGAVLDELLSSSLSSRTLNPATRSDGWPADEPQCDDAALER